MNTMENFASFIRNIPDSDPLANRTPIKVAVIDDGIDLCYHEEQFSTTMKTGQSFCTGSKPHPFFFSSTGHGTLMADLVQRICPRVHLYIARLNARETGSPTQYTPESAARVSQFSIYYLRLWSFNGFNALTVGLPLPTTYMTHRRYDGLLTKKSISSQ